MVVADFFLLRIEAHALSDYSLIWLAGCAPYREWHLESNDQCAGCVEVAGARAEWVLAGKFISGGNAFLVRGDVSVIALVRGLFALILLL
jgi:hypothetical protein